MRRMPYLALGVLSVLSLVSSAPASVVVPLSFQELVRHSEGILAGTVSKIESARYGEDFRTYVTFRDLDIIKGAYAESAYILELMCGDLNGEGILIVGAPNFSEGQRVVLFIDGNTEHLVPIVGLSQGVFLVEDDHGKKIVKDNVGNRILSLSERGMKKEARYEDAGLFVGTSKAMTVQAGGNASSQQGTAAPEGDAALEFDSFLKAIVGHAAAIGDAGKPLISAIPGARQHPRADNGRGGNER